MRASTTQPRPQHTRTHTLASWRKNWPARRRLTGSNPKNVLRKSRVCLVPMESWRLDKVGPTTASDTPWYVPVHCQCALTASTVDDSFSAKLP